MFTRWRFQFSSMRTFNNAPLPIVYNFSVKTQNRRSFFPVNFLQKIQNPNFCFKFLINPTMSEDIPPNNTIYLKNLNEKIKIPRLKVALGAAFSQFGTILEIYAKKSLRQRGQAFIVFKDIDSAIEAVQSMPGFPFYDKPMVVQFAKTDSDLIAKQKGTYVERSGTNRSKPENRNKKVSNKPKYSNPTPQAYDPVNHILFLQNLPQDPSQYTTDLEMYLGQYPGFRELRRVPGRMDIAFVEYEDENMATAAKAGMHGFRIGVDNTMVVTYAKK